MNNKLLLLLLYIGFINFQAYASCCGGNSMNNDMMFGDQYWNVVASEPFKPTGKTRYMYIAADEVIHDYAPLGYNGITGEPYDEVAAEFTERRADRIGTQFIKCIYREYTSDSFKTLKERSLNEQYLGYLGPVIRGEIGDTIKITYKNNCKFPNNIYSRGVFDDKGNLPVQPGETYNYVWEVAERSGPGLHDGSSVFWKYQSNVNVISDLYAGLIGYIVVTKKGWANKDGSPKDIDHEIFWMFSITNENSSPYIDDNIRKFLPDVTDIPALKRNAGFTAANFKYGIDTFIYGNSPMLVLKKNERCRWYVMSVGGGRDIHTPHWHGNILLIDGMHMDVASMLPGELIIADMVPDDVGIWLAHCHLAEHFDDGMITRYQVVDKYKY